MVRGHEGRPQGSPPISSSTRVPTIRARSAPFSSPLSRLAALDPALVCGVGLLFRARQKKVTRVVDLLARWDYNT